MKYANSRECDGRVILSGLAGQWSTTMPGEVDLTMEDTVQMVRGTIDPEFVVVNTGKDAGPAAFVEAD